MKLLNKKLKQYLGQLDKVTYTRLEFNESDIGYKIQTILREQNIKYPTANYDTAELIAFMLQTKTFKSDKNDWGTTYYEPPDKDDNGLKGLTLADITPKFVKYWSQRAAVSNNATLKRRYAKLVIDFSPIILGKKASLQTFKLAVEANIYIYSVETNVFGGIIKIREALDLAIESEAKQCIKTVKASVFKKIKNDQENAVSIEFALEHFLVDKNFADNHMTYLEQAKLLKVAHQKLEDFNDDKQYNLLDIARLLHIYYRNQRDDMKEIKAKLEYLYVKEKRCFCCPK